MAISYADRGGTKGYQVRITRNGKQYTKFFNAKERGARKKAVAYEKQLLELLGPANTSGRGERRPIRTNTGIRYITETVGKYNTACFRVTYREENGHWASRDISIDHHGRAAAMRIAKKIHRERHVAANRVETVKTPSPKAVKKMLEEE